MLTITAPISKQSKRSPMHRVKVVSEFMHLKSRRVLFSFAQIPKVGKRNRQIVMGPRFIGSD